MKLTNSLVWKMDTMFSFTDLWKEASPMEGLELSAQTREPQSDRMMMVLHITGFRITTIFVNGVSIVLSPPYL